MKIIQHIFMLIVDFFAALIRGRQLLPISRKWQLQSDKCLTLRPSLYAFENFVWKRLYYIAYDYQLK